MLQNCSENKREKLALFESLTKELATIDEDFCDLISLINDFESNVSEKADKLKFFVIWLLNNVICIRIQNWEN